MPFISTWTDVVHWASELKSELRTFTTRWPVDNRATVFSRRSVYESVVQIDILDNTLFG